jgi:apolipoprotein N-acyltransferase
MFWLQTLVYRWVGNFGLSLVPWLLSGIVAAFYFATAGLLVQLCWKQGRPWLIPLAWAGVEVFRSFVPALAFPWGLAATPLTDYPAIIQTAFYGTIYFVSAWVVLGNVLAAMALGGDRFAAMRTYAMAFTVILLASISRYYDAPRGVPTPFSIGQPGVDMAFGSPEKQQRELRASLAQQIVYAAIQKPRVFVLPEGLISAGDQFPPEAPFLIPPGLAVLFGGQRGTDPVYQSAFAFDGRWQYADKTRLVIFGEYVPGRHWLPLLDKFKLPGGDLTPASTVTALKVNGVTIGPMLCFEGLFSDVAQRQVQNGAQVLAVMCIDDWYMGTAAPAQLRAGAIWRAVESGLPVLRSASTGYTLAADARGNVLAEAPLGRAATCKVEVTLPDKPERMPLRPIMPWILLASCPLIAILGLARRGGRSEEGRGERSKKVNIP